MVCHKTITRWKTLAIAILGICFSNKIKYHTQNVHKFSIDIHFIMINNQINKQWRVLHLFNLYRLLIAGTFVSFIYTNITLAPFGSLEPELFQLVSILYLFLSVISGFTIRMRWPDFFLQTHLQLTLDMILLTVMLYSSGGIISGMGILMLIPVVSSSLLLLQTAPIYAAFASLLILAEQLYFHWVTFEDAAYTQTGILGIIFFISSLLSYYLVKHAKEHESLAEERGVALADMEQLAAFVIQKMQIGVMVLTPAGEIRFINEIAKQLCPKITPLADNQLHNLSPQLFELYQLWLNNSTHNEQTISACNNADIRPHFFSLGNDTEPDTLIYLEDISHLSQQAQQLKLASLGRLTASIAHEVRNPLSAINHAGALLAESADGLNAIDKRLTEIIKTNALRIDKIIQTVLNLGRQNTLSHSEKLSLETYLRQFINDYLQTTNIAPDDILLEICTDNDIIVFDPIQLQQILTNLLENALRHSHHYSKAPKVIISVGMDLSSGAKYLDIVNQGSIINKTNENQLFEPFFTTQTTGTGLGLYISRELAINNKAHLSYIAKENAVCFRLRFSHKCAGKS